MVFAGLVGIVGQRVKLVPLAELVESSGFVIGWTQEVVGVVVVVVVVVGVVVVVVVDVISFFFPK